MTMEATEIPRKLSTGTTTMALICSDGVVVGADTRATAGTFIANTEVRKVFKIDSNLSMTVAGSVGDAQELIRIIKAQNEIYKMNENRPLSPKSAASLLSIILQQNKMMPFYVELIVAGLDGDEPQIFNLDPIGGSVEESKFSATGSGSYVAIGFLEDMYKKGITTKEGVKGVARALQLAMRRDSATGNGMKITTITKSGYTEYTEKDIEKMSQQK
ncbi:MAG: proteasome subunit beta [Candidatus Micrarchaeaceae archaeon]